MPSTSKPVIVLVPGAWHTPAHYAHLALHLNALGYTVDCIDPPSTSAPPPTDPYTEDVLTIRNAITSHTGAGRDVVLVMHSFGGITGSEAAWGLGVANAEGEGKVVRLVYMTAFMVVEGWKRQDFGVGEEWPNIVALDEENPNTVLPLNPLHFFYHDVPPHAADRALQNLCPMPLSHAKHAVSKAAWREIPVSYILCEEDRAITEQGAEQMIGIVRGEGVEVEVKRLGAGHSPFLSKPRETAGLIHGFVR